MMGKNIRFSSDKFDICIKNVLDISGRYADHMEEWEKICRLYLDDLPEEVIDEILEIRNRYSEIVESLLFEAEKMKRISEVYAFWEARNCQLVEGLSSDVSKSSRSSDKSSYTVDIPSWSGKIRSGKLMGRNILMEDWLFSCVARRSLQMKARGTV